MQHVFRIEYKAIEFSTNKKDPTVTFPIRQYWNDNEAAPASGGFVNKANCWFKWPRLLHRPVHQILVSVP